MSPSELERQFIAHALPLCGATLYPASSAMDLIRTAQTHNIAIKRIEAVHLENHRTLPRFIPSGDVDHFQSAIGYIEQLQHQGYVFEITY